VVASWGQWLYLREHIHSDQQHAPAQGGYLVNFFEWQCMVNWWSTLLGWKE
jgi:hypothetical protein